MYVLRCGRHCPRISRRGAAPTMLLYSSTMTTISSAALITVLASSAKNRPKRGTIGLYSCHHTTLACFGAWRMRHKQGQRIIDNGRDDSLREERWIAAL